MDLARAPRRARLTARKKGSGYENDLSHPQPRPQGLPRGGARAEEDPLSCIITGGPAPILRSVNQVKPKTWRIFRQNDAISMTTGP